MTYETTQLMENKTIGSSSFGVTHMQNAFPVNCSRCWIWFFLTLCASIIFLEKVRILHVSHKNVNYLLFCFLWAVLFHKIYAMLSINKDGGSLIWTLYQIIARTFHKLDEFWFLWKETNAPVFVLLLPFVFLPWNWAFSNLYL